VAIESRPHRGALGHDDVRGARLKTYVALLRGINLGARNKVSMADLRALFLALESEDVKTYVQSGNVVFKSPVGSAAELSRAIEKRIDRDLGLRVTVLVRTPAQLEKLRAGNPFARNEKDPIKLHVTFLAETPGRDRVRKLEQTEAGPDAFRVVGREIYLHCPNGYGRSKLSNAYFEKQLDVAATTRNWKTVTKLAELAGA
jgi:uncharacterized protein (DUF1697 family)